MGKQGFPVLANTMKVLMRNGGSQHAAHSAQYANYLMRWYIGGGKDLVPAGDFSTLALELMCFTSAPTNAVSCSMSGLAFLQAAGIALDRCSIAHLGPPPEGLLEKALDKARWLVPCSDKSSGRIVAGFLGSV